MHTLKHVYLYIFFKIIAVRIRPLFSITVLYKTLYNVGQYAFFPDRICCLFMCANKQEVRARVCVCVFVFVRV